MGGYLVHRSLGSLVHARTSHFQAGFPTLQLLLVQNSEFLGMGESSWLYVVRLLRTRVGV